MQQDFETNQLYSDLFFWKWVHENFDRYLAQYASEAEQASLTLHQVEWEIEACCQNLAVARALVHMPASA